ncbi:hypothetical protein CLOP_g8407 [Closterium sp. NIES-67]|nr:hypothetical protein CLOP_g8407 [Closterium sp. NIES-67]
MHQHDYVHRDFKASNVLLREDLTPVLADFGLARTVNNWQSHVTTRVMGSTGYIDPVYFESGHLNANAIRTHLGSSSSSLCRACWSLTRTLRG